MFKNRFIGSVFLIAATAIGGGALGLPLVAAGAGPIYTLALLVITWALTYFSCLVVLQLNLVYGSKANFDTMASSTLGPAGVIVIRISILLLGYSLLAAYITGGSSIIEAIISSIFGFDISIMIISIFFASIIVYLTFLGIKIIERVNRIFTFFEVSSLLLISLIMFFHVESVTLMEKSNELKYLPIAIPIFFTTFGCQLMVPPVANYLKNDYKKICKALLIGTTIPLILYIFYTLTILNAIPKYGEVSFQSIAHTGNNLGDLLKTLVILYQSNFLNAVWSCFLGIAILTSVICIALALFDFLVDLFRKRSITNYDKVGISLLTILPPLVFALFYPEGFILALGYAACASALYSFILPVIMVYKLKYIDKININKKIGSNLLLLATVFFSGVIVIVIEILAKIKILPQFF